MNGVRPITMSDTRQLLIDTADIISCPPRYTMTLNASTRISQFVEAKFWKVTEARLCKEVLNPSYTKAAGYIANIWRTALMSGARLVSLIETVLKPHDSIDTLILRELVITTAQNIWCLLKRIWKKKGIEVVPGDWPQLSHKPSFHAKTLIYTVFIGGITAVLNVFMKVTKVSELKKKLNSRLKAYLRKIPEQYLRLLPRYFHSLLTSGKAAKTSYAVKSRRADSQ
ncbi:hypothetical protein SK128_025167 [Halocaridina rubra]|uniref:Uncharacterized protein n=1 Tax=Halocaridina rubra TaxID=373956 RepID=A0AAN8WEC4_HALRR